MRAGVCLVFVTVWMASAALAQMGGGSAPQRISLAGGLQRSYATIKQNLTGAVEMMAEPDFAFKPTPDVRAFGQLFGHASNSMYSQCAAARGEANPNQGNDLEKQVTKADVTKSLAAVFAFCDPAFSSLTDENALQMVKQGNNEVARAYVLAGLVAHDNEMYGTSVVYLRLKGHVPPSTERMRQMRQGAK